MWVETVCGSKVRIDHITSFRHTVYTIDDTYSYAGDLFSRSEKLRMALTERYGEVPAIKFITTNGCVFITLETLELDCEIIT
jgi:hypothetical protein